MFAKVHTVDLISDFYSVMQLCCTFTSKSRFNKHGTHSKRHTLVVIDCHTTMSTYIPIDQNMFFYHSGEGIEYKNAPRMEKVVVG